MVILCLRIMAYSYQHGLATQCHEHVIAQPVFELQCISWYLWVSL